MTASTTPRQPKSRIARHLRFGQRPPDSVAIGMLDRGQVILRYPIGKEAPITLRSSTRLLDMDLRLWLDLELGELRAAGHIRIRRLLRRKWRTIFESEGKAIVHMDPSVGVIDGRSEGYAPDLRAAAKELKFPEEFARVRLCAPVPLRFYVDDKLRFVSNAGQIVKRKIFPAPYGSFVFNTVACVGEPDDQGRGAYADPQSPWFNIFLGYYQIDVEVSKWGRPFGYESDAGIESEVHHEDIIRLGKADWNWFSNWMYGVPAEYLENDIDAIDPDTSVEVSPQFPKIGDSLWHSVAMNNVKVKSCFESDAPGAPKLVNNSPLTFVWRDAFGRPYPRKGKNYESFMPITLRADMHIAYSRDGRFFRTRMFGGTVRAKDPDRDPKFSDAFLATQMLAMRRMIAMHYPDMGFPDPTRPRRLEERFAGEPSATSEGERSPAGRPPA